MTNDVILCDDDGLCNSCTEQECVECSDGTRLSDGKCVPCSDTLPHCDRCSSANNCEMCNSNIASLENGRCTSCQYGWTQVFNNPSKNCECSEFVNVIDDYKCQSCFDLIPGCNRCEQVVQPEDEFYIEIGYEVDISSSEGKYLVCRDSGSLIQNKETGLFKTCDELIPNCVDCNEDGSSCNECENRYFKVNSGNNEVCDPCTDRFTEQCLECSEADGCLDCEEGYRKRLNLCWKKIW